MGSSVVRTLLAIAVLASLVWFGLYTRLRVVETEAQSLPASVPGEVTAWIRSSALPIEWTDSLSADMDLSSLPALVGDAGIVLLGEATHGTRECRDVNALVTRYLIEEMGFSCLALEESPDHLQEINRYIDGHSDPAESAVLSLGSWIWRTKGMVDVAHWLRDRNQAATQPVFLAGIDMGDPWACIESVSSYIKEYAPGDENVATMGFSRFLTHRDAFADYALLDSAEQTACRSGLQRVLNWLVEHRDILLERTSVAQYLAALCGARGILFNEEAARGDMFASVRERCMTENVRCLEEYLGRVIVWAHNLHAATHSIGAWQSMGIQLRDSAGDRLITLGYSVVGGDFTVLALDEKGAPRSLEAVSLPEATHGSVEDALSAVGLPSFALDLRGLEPGSSAAVWFGFERTLRTIGATYHPDFSGEVSISAALSHLFDVVVHLSTSHPTILLRSGALHDAEARGDGPTNGEFEDGLQGWQLSGTDPASYHLEVVSRNDGSGSCAKLSASSAMPDASGNVKQICAASLFRDAQLRMTARIRTADVEGWVGMWLVVLTPDGVAAMDNMSDRPIRGDMAWQNVEIVINVPEDAEMLYYGVSLYGRGTVWVDDVWLARIE